MYLSNTLSQPTLEPLTHGQIDPGVKTPCSKNICYAIFFFNFNILIIRILNMFTEWKCSHFFFPDLEAREKKLKKLSFFFLIREEELKDKEYSGRKKKQARA